MSQKRKPHLKFGEVEQRPSKAKHVKQPRQYNPLGTRVKILGSNGKIRWGWQ